MPTPRKKSIAKKPQREVAGNLDMDGDKLKIYSLANILQHKADHNPKSRKVSTLGEVLTPWFEKNVEKPAEKLGACVDVWIAHVPAKLAGGTRLVTFHRGTLTVAAESAIIRAELDAALRKGLLATLQTSSKGTIYRVKTCVSGREIPEIS